MKRIALLIVLVLSIVLIAGCESISQQSSAVGGFAKPPMDSISGGSEESVASVKSSDEETVKEVETIPADKVTANTSEAITDAVVTEKEPDENEDHIFIPRVEQSPQMTPTETAEKNSQNNSTIQTPQDQEKRSENSQTPKTDEVKEQEDSTEPQNPVPPSEGEESKTEEEVHAATADDSIAIADRVVEYLNSFRGTPASKLPGLTNYAQYRSRQIVSNFSHDTDDQRAAATSLQYGEYVDPPLYGMTGDPYYTVNAREAIAKAGYYGTAEYVAEQLALQFKNSPSHWLYISDGKYQYIAVGVTYQNGTWYCVVTLTQTNTDNN